MTHLKLFEKFDKSEYYQEITFIDYVNLRGVKFENCNKFSIKEKRYLRSFSVLNDYYSGIYLHCKIGDNNYPDQFYIRPYINKKLNSEYKIVYIDKLPDEWFVVQMKTESVLNSDFFTEKFWKCDQLDGLEELLRDQGIIR